MATLVQSQPPLEASNSVATISTTVTDGTVNTGGFATAPTAGNTVILLIHSEDLSATITSPTSVADGAGNSFTLAGSGVSPSKPNERVDVYYRLVTTGGQTAARTITVTKNAPTNFQEFAIYQTEWLGLWVPLSGGSVGGGNAVSPSSAAVTITTPISVPSGALSITGVNIHDTTATTLTPSTPTGYTAIYTESNQAAVMSQNMCYLTTASAGTLSVTYTGQTTTSDIVSAVLTPFVPFANNCSVAYWRA